MTDEARLRALIEKWRDSARFLGSLNNDLPTTKQDIVRFRHCADELAALIAAGRSASKHTEQCIEISLLLGAAGFPEEIPIQEAVRQLIQAAGPSKPPRLSA